MALTIMVECFGQTNLETSTLRETERQATTTADIASVDTYLPRTTNTQTQTPQSFGKELLTNQPGVLPKIEITASGAVARGGKHTVTFDGNLNHAEAIGIQLSPGKILKGVPVAVSISDDAGNRVILGQLQDCDGVLLDSGSQVLYANAFNGIAADVLYTYQLRLFEQDIILRERPLLPAGIDERSAKLEIWTEFFTDIEPRKRKRQIDFRNLAMAIEDKREIRVEDEELDFGEMSMANGRAFLIDEKEQAWGRGFGELNGARRVSVAKKWIKHNNRKFLLESVDFLSIKSSLDDLDVQEPAAIALKDGVDLSFLDSSARLQERGRRALKQDIQVAAATSLKGFVIDYLLVSWGPLLNVDFGHGTVGKHGAIYKDESNDIWNGVKTPIYNYPDLSISDGTPGGAPSGISLFMNASGHWSVSGSPGYPNITTPMFNDYIYNSSGNAEVVLVGAVGGVWTLRIYGAWGGIYNPTSNPFPNGRYKIEVAGPYGITTYNTVETFLNQGWDVRANNGEWTKGEHYAVVEDVIVPDGNVVKITALPGGSGLPGGNIALINGLQMTGSGSVSRPPFVGSISNQSIPGGTQVGPIQFWVSNYQGEDGDLVLSAFSGNTTLVPNDGIVLGGADALRTITVRPAAGPTGKAAITVIVASGEAQTAQNFVVDVTAPLPAVAAPAINPSTGTFSSPQTVTITCATAGASIYYGLNQSDPNLVYSGPFQVTSSTTVYSRAKKPGMTDSPVSSATLTITATTDSDGDGLLDSWETQHFGNLSQLGSGDFDSDGFTNLYEFQNGTNPTQPPANPDMDADGLPDAWEVQHFGHVNNDANHDSDGDGYENFEELLLQQNPVSPDIARPLVSLSVPDNATSESGADIASFRISRSIAATTPLKVHYSLGGSASRGRDYEPVVTGSVLGEATIPAGQQSVTVALRGIEDSEYEGTEKISVTLSPDLKYLRVVVSPVEVNLLDNDKPKVGIRALDGSVSESGLDKGLVVVERSGNLEASLTVNLSFGGTAVAQSDYVGVAASQTFPSGTARIPLVITPIGDLLYEPLKTLSISIVDNAAYTVTERTAQVKITDDDKPEVTILAVDDDLRENLNHGQVRISRTGDTSLPLTVLADWSGSAAANADYAPVEFSLLAGESSRLFTVQVKQDTVSETMETVVVTLKGNPEYKVGNLNTVSLYIDDDEARSFVGTLKRNSAVNSAVAGGTTKGLIEVVRKGSVYGAGIPTLTIGGTADLANGTSRNAILGTDFTLSGNISGSTIVFPSRSSTALIEVGASSALSVALGVNSSDGLHPMAQQAIYFLKPSQVVRLQVPAVELVQGGASQAIIVKRDQASSSSLEVRLEISGTARRGIDHNLGNQYYWVTIPPNATTAPSLVVQVPTTSKIKGRQSIVVSMNPLISSSTEFGYSIAGSANQMFLIRENVSAAKLATLPSSDTDGDQLPDHFEMLRGFNALLYTDATRDEDRDGVNLLGEDLLGTDPSLLDEGVFGDVDIDINFVDVSGAVPYVDDWRVLVGPESITHSGSHIDRGAFIEHKLLPIRLARGRTYPVRLRHISGSSSVRVSHAPNYNSGAPSFIPYPDYIVDDPNGVFALNPTFEPPDGFETTYLRYAEIADTESKIAHIIVPRIDLTWEAAAVNAPALSNLPIEENTLIGVTSPNSPVMAPGGGYRVFAGALTPTENLPRNIVNLKIKTTPPLPNRVLYLKSFDVDDPSSEDIVIDSQTVDSNGELGDDNRLDHLNTPKTGVFTGSGAATHSVTLDQNGEKVVEFKIGMQPGNNYRIAATLFPAPNTTMNRLQVSDHTDAFFVAEGDGQIRSGLFNGILSPMLTVWRRLILEVDSMTAISTTGANKNQWETKVHAHKALNDGSGQSIMFVPGVSPARDNDAHEFGDMNVLGSKYVVRRNVEAFGDSYLIVDGVPATSLKGEVATITDDDDSAVRTYFGLPSFLPTTSHNTRLFEALSPLFSPAYIAVVDAGALNVRPTIPFAPYGHSGHSVFFGLFTGPTIFDDSMDIYDSLNFWCHTVTFGFQEYTPFLDANMDGDPNIELERGLLLGGTVENQVTHKPDGYSFIFLEHILDDHWRGKAVNAFLRIQGTPSLPQHVIDYERSEVENSYWNWPFGIIAHEIGHAPLRFGEAADHAEEGIMKEGGTRLGPYSERFTAKTLKRFRDAKSWTN